MNSNLISIASAAFLSLIATSTVAKSPPRYTIIDLGRPEQSQHFYPFSLNNRSQVVGWAYYATNPTAVILHATLYDRGVFTDLGALLQDPLSVARDINNAGHIVLTKPYPDVLNPGRSFIYAPNPQPTLTPIADDRFTFIQANALNDRGIVAGTAGLRLGEPTSPEHTTAFVYQNGVITPLGSVAPDAYSAAHDINKAGDVLGDVFDFFNFRRAVIFSEGKITDIGALVGRSSSGVAINDHGHAVGFLGTPYAAPQPAHSRAFLYRDGQISLLPLLARDVESYPTDINNHDEVIGRAGTFDMQETRSFLYSNGTMYDLSDLIPPGSELTLDFVLSINDHGVIAGFGRHGGGDDFRAFLLVPGKD